MAMQGARTLTWNKRRARPRDSGTWIELRRRRIRELSHRGTDQAPARAEARAVHRSDSTMEPREVSRAGCLHKPDTVPQITAQDKEPEQSTSEESMPPVIDTWHRYASSRRQGGVDDVRLGSDARNGEGADQEP